jgi:hypothetical protein
MGLSSSPPPGLPPQGGGKKGYPKGGGKEKGNPPPKGRRKGILSQLDGGKKDKFLQAILLFF